MPEAKLQASGRAWTQTDFVQAHQDLERALGIVLHAAALSRGKLDLVVAGLRASLREADDILYAADQAAAAAARREKTELEGG